MNTLKGIFVPNIVPYRRDGSINEEELRRIVSWLIDNGVSGLYPNGSMGEFIRLTFEERKEVVRIIADEAAGRVPILAGAAEANPEMVLEMCHFCADHGCEAVSITGPYYYKPSQESIEEYFRMLARESPIDIVIYNIPSFSTEVSLPVLERLAMDCPRITGTKDSSADMCRFLHILNDIKGQRPEFAALVGWEELIVPSLIMGGDGGTLSTAGVAPEAIMKIFNDAVSGNLDEARRLQFKLLELFQTMLSTINFPAGFRLGYEIRGFDVGPPRFPYSPREKANMESIRSKIACLLGECGFKEAARQCESSTPPSRPVFQPERSLAPGPGHSKIDIQEIVREVVKSMKPSK